MTKREIIKNLRNQGKTFRFIGNTLKISKQAVHQLFNTKEPPAKKVKIPKPIKYCSCGKIAKIIYCPSCNKIKLHTGRGRTRELVRIRDNHTCQNCGKKWIEKTRRFDVHHLNGLCGKKSRSYDKISEMDKLITLCHKCHYHRHDFNP